MLHGGCDDYYLLSSKSKRMKQFQKKKKTFLPVPCRLLLLLLFWFPAVAFGKIEDDSLVKVYDNVLSDEAASWLNTKAVDWPNTDVVFEFPLKEPDKHTPIEQVLNQIMHELYPDNGGNENGNDSSPRYYVEFWKRTPWVHISAHADMDEGHGKQTEHSSPEVPYKHPETGHVLYLEMGSAVEGPTVVWNVTKGGDFYKQRQSEMVTVPAVQGRLLRFQGHALHAVPRPADLYWSHQLDSREGPEFQRSVILFNTWPYAEDNLLIDYEIQNATETENKPILKSQSCNPKSNWIDVEVVKYQPPQTQSWWSSILGLSSSSNKLFQVPLMGNPRRKGTQDYVAKLIGPIEIPELLKESNQVTSIDVTVPQHLLSSTTTEL